MKRILNESFSYENENKIKKGMNEVSIVKER